MPEKRNKTLLADLGEFSLGSAGHRPLRGFWVGSSKKKSCLAVCSGLTKEENDNKPQHCGTLVCTGTLQIH